MACSPVRVIFGDAARHLSVQSQADGLGHTVYFFPESFLEFGALVVELLRVAQPGHIDLESSLPAPLPSHDAMLAAVRQLKPPVTDSLAAAQAILKHLEAHSTGRLPVEFFSRASSAFAWGKTALETEREIFFPRSGISISPLGSSAYENLTYPKSLATSLLLGAAFPTDEPPDGSGTHHNLKKAIGRWKLLEPAVKNPQGSEHLMALRILHLVHLEYLRCRANYLAADRDYTAAFITSFRSLELICDLVLLSMRKLRVTDRGPRGVIFDGLKDKWSFVVSELAALGLRDPSIDELGKCIPVRNRSFLAHGLQSIGFNGFQHYSRLLSDSVALTAGALQLTSELAEIRTAINGDKKVEHIVNLTLLRIVNPYLVSHS